MRKINFLIILFAIMIIPAGVFAQVPSGWQDGDSITLCRNNCDYNSLDVIFDDISAGAYNTDVLGIEIYDAYEYKVQSHDLSMIDYIVFTNSDYANNNINISGANKNVTLEVGEMYFTSFNRSNYTVKLTDLTINSDFALPKGRSTPRTDFSDAPDYGTVNIYTNSIIDNVKINSYEHGFVLYSMKQHNINAYVYNGNKYAILMLGDGTQLNERSINITNSKMAGCECSLVIYDYGYDAVNYNGGNNGSTFNGGPIKRVVPSPMAITNYNIKVDNSDVSCVKYGAQSSTSASNPTIYFTSSNKWSKVINKCYVEEDNCNVLQGINSKIIIDQENNLSITLKDKVNLQSYFPELKSVNPKDITWSVSNPKVLKIVDGKAIPLKAGDCVVTATYNDMNYTLNFRVTNKTQILANPNTGARLFLVIALVLFIGGVAVYVVMHKTPKYEN